MAVSAYAARSDPEGLSVRARLLPDGQALLEADDVDERSEGRLPEAARPTAADTATPAPPPTVAPRYAAPAWASPAVRTGGSRGDLSPGPRVWPVLSLRPRPADLLGLAQGGLDIPPDQLAVMQQVALWTGLPWQLLAAIAKVESDFGRNMDTSSAGAIGYGQFLPETWAQYGDGGDPYDFRDTLPAMGRYLLAAGALDDLASALYSYNHSWDYVAEVLSLATAYGYDGSRTDQPIGTNPGLIWPVVGAVSSLFSEEHPAIDIDPGATPDAPVQAAHDGVVLFAGGDPCCLYGFYILLVGPSGMTTLYAHLGAVVVTPGQTVRQGQAVGAVGCTGNCTGPHLHFEVIVEGERRNPMDYLP